MAITSNRSSRRSFLLHSAPAVAGGLATLGLTGDAFAEKPQSTANSEKGKIWSKECWAQKGEVKLYMFRKRVGAPQSGKSVLPVLFLVHGSSTSSRSFDLTVPGHGDYSLMDQFAGYGFDVWTMDFEGYGRSSRTEGNSDIASGVEDLKAAVEIVAHETGQERFHFFGESSGALRAGALPWSGRSVLTEWYWVPSRIRGKVRPRWPIAASKWSFTARTTGGRAIET